MIHVQGKGALVAAWLAGASLGRPVLVDEVRPLARAALGEVFDLSFEELPAEDGHGLWSQSIHGNLAARS